MTSSVEPSYDIWDATGFRVFLSHKAVAKEYAAWLKGRLQWLGISAFVAHEDIAPTDEWLRAIEHGLSTMEALVALLTEDFHESDWTDQEVGWALGRKIPIISVKMGRAPYGFFGKQQALSCESNVAPREIVRLLLRHPRMREGYIAAVEHCTSWDMGNAQAELLPLFEALAPAEIEGLVAAYNSNTEVSGSFGFRGIYPNSYGYGLAYHLTRITGQPYEVLDTGELVVLDEVAEDEP